MAPPRKQQTYLQIYTPVVLPLAVVNISSGSGAQPAVLGAALQHPPVDLAMYHGQVAEASGPRSDVAAEQMGRLYKAWPGSPPVNVEIESAIPSALGLGSETMLGLGIAKGLARLGGRSEEAAELAPALGLGPECALDVQCAASGGLLLVNAQANVDIDEAPLRHTAIAHDDNRAWGFVIVQPRAHGAILDESDATRLRRVITACQTLDTASGRLVQDALFPAVKADDLEAFGAALTTLQEMNRAILAQAAVTLASPPNADAIFDIMRQNGAVACGQSLSGLALFALTRGARATINMRAALRRVFPHNAGYMLATIVDNRGLRLIERQK